MPGCGTARVRGKPDSPPGDYVERVATIHVDDGVFFHAVKSSEDGLSFFQQALHPGAAPNAQRKGNCAAGANREASATKDDGEEPTPPK